MEKERRGREGEEGGSQRLGIVRVRMYVVPLRMENFNNDFGVDG